MTTLNISLPEAMRAFIDEQVAGGGYSTASEYLRELIRAAQKRAAQERLEALLLEGLDSGPTIEVNDEFWANVRTRAAERLRQKKTTND